MLKRPFSKYLGNSKIRKQISVSLGEENLNPLLLLYHENVVLQRIIRFLQLHKLILFPYQIIH